MTRRPGTRSFHKAIVRQPGPSFAQGLSTSGLGPPILEKALEQHDRYRRALEQAGLEVICLAADPEHPDSTFVEDVAVLTPRGAILTRPGAPSRQGEVAGMRDALDAHFAKLQMIQPPGTLDGGDVCEAGSRFFVGLSERTNEEGVRQLAAFLRHEGLSTTPVDIRQIPGLLHLKSGIACLEEGRLAVVPELTSRAEFKEYEIVPVDPEERYAANCLPINGRVLVAAGFPKFLATLRERRFDVVVLDVSEFRKMDGGLSCLSLRF